MDMKNTYTLPEANSSPLKIDKNRPSQKETPFLAII